MKSASPRTATIQRSTLETSLELSLDLDGSGSASVTTGIGFLDHLLISFCRFARFDLELTCTGDLDVDDHHSAEDCGIALGLALKEAIGDGVGINRFGYAWAPLDESLSRAVVDISGRPFADILLSLNREALGALSCENVGHVLSSMAMSAGLTLHVDVIKGQNDHHKAESAYKACGLAFAQAVSRSGFGDIPSTKGVLQ